VDLEYARVFGVSHPKRRIVIRRIETWVIRFRPLDTDGSIDRTTDEPCGTTDERDDATNATDERDGTK
jgi:hypothetical protein